MHAGGTAELAERLVVTIQGRRKIEIFLIDELDKQTAKQDLKTYVSLGQRDG